MKTRLPSPALVISIIALVVACTATAYAATVISSSSQIKNGAVKGVDIKNRTIKGRDIAKRTITPTNLSKSTLKRIDTAGGNATGIEVVRKAGPENQPPQQNIKVLEMTVPAGAYIVSAKVTQQGFPPTGPFLPPPVLVALGHCKLDAAGYVDDSLAVVAASQRSASGQHKMQTTVTVGANAKLAIICDSTITWRTSNASIIANRVGSVMKSGG